jgi:hypothetical protein
MWRRIHNPSPLGAKRLELLRLSIGRVIYAGAYLCLGAENRAGGRKAEGSAFPFWGLHPPVPWPSPRPLEVVAIGKWKTPGLWQPHLHLTPRRACRPAGWQSYPQAGAGRSEGSAALLWGLHPGRLWPSPLAPTVALRRWRTRIGWQPHIYALLEQAATPASTHWGSSGEWPGIAVACGRIQDLVINSLMATAPASYMPLEQAETPACCPWAQA